jgi:ribosome biogenesis GTPase
VLSELDGPGLPGRVVGSAGGEATVAVALPDGSCEHRTVSGKDLDVPGTWVRLEDRAVVALAPRTRIVRTAAGRSSRAQVLAVDIDAVLVCTSAAAPLRPGRVERWLALVWDSGAHPVVVLTKADLRPGEERAELLAAVIAISPGADVHLVSSVTGDGVAELAAAHGGPGRTLALLGASGAGKSSLVNALAGTDLCVGGIRESDGRGRHTTVARVLVPLPDGGVLLDTPGLRGLALHDGGEGLAGAYPEIADLALDCRFSDCKHAGEPGCSVAAAVDAGVLDAGRVTRHAKLMRELAWQESRRDAHARAQRSRELRRWARAHKSMPHR